MKLILENIGIIEKADIDIDGLTVIAGNNDSGKSTVGKIAYSLTKSFEDFELDYEKSKNQAIRASFRNLYRFLRQSVDLRKNSKLREIIETFIFYDVNIDNKKALKAIDELKKMVDNDTIKLNSETKSVLNHSFERINLLYLENKSKNSKILDFINKIFESEFRNQISNIFTKKSKISVLEGRNTIINLNVTNDKISNDKSKQIDGIFPFDSSVFIETPFILTYKDALENSDDIYHLNDLLKKLTTPNTTNKDNILNISKIINGEILFDEQDESFSFKKNSGKNKVTIDILNAASGIKSLGILQLLDKSGAFDKNLLLIIDEPEVHLHPDWQVEYSKLLIQLVKKGIKILVTSHSPYLIEALNKFSKKEGITNLTKFYLSESNINGKATIVDKTEDKDEIFEKLSKPFEKLLFDE